MKLFKYARFFYRFFSDYLEKIQFAIKKYI